ncbi:PTS sugar transporter subunit IIC [uncultured Dubosiella sp.]|uniref:PTS mannose/fructose/sorbose/N-acetylgalactosamine transporter subunit IIC n=1 Tax=uncultured Dubosiella sp. TaxID=1937011 RepID=UPI00207E2EA9|nr:PTS sugar transporter subunit IIC [uncultured Dubosiella sp.]GJM58569.1 PTS sorbose transporter subunit IIC [Erysipelotrichaceae bacterium OPF54]GJM58642.1 PTS sorbose transporter subunit IIC [Erysipelotrichaceae bacterium OPF54]GJM58715.1 PTS sorbose transporter subunit IIC [Erysipelotrichaceae bacterium OPF54]
METLSITQSLIIALWVAAVMSRWLLGGATLTLRFSPLMTGLVCGIVMNQVKEAMIVTAALQLIYMGVFSPGGSMPSEPCVAAAIAVPVALLGDLDATEAVAIAVPVGLLGGYLYQFRFFLNTFVGQATDKAVEKMDERAIRRSIITYPTLVSFALYVPLIFIALYLGVPLIADAIAALEGTAFIHILQVVGNGLAAIGIATTIYVIGRKDLMVFFFLAYFMSVIFASLKITMVTYAILGVIIAVIYSQLKRQPAAKAAPAAAEGMMDEEDDDDYDDGF